MSHSFEAVYGGGILSPGEFMPVTFNAERNSDIVILLRGDLNVSTLVEAQNMDCMFQKFPFLQLNSLIELQAWQFPTTRIMDSRE
jgi:hypothetical protein